MYSNITVERLEQIELERQETHSDPLYREWLQQLNVSSSYVDRQLIHNANHAMQDWDSTRLNIERITIK